MTDYIDQHGTQVSFPKDGKSWVILSDIECPAHAELAEFGDIV
jgi:hypothetical protein